MLHPAVLGALAIFVVNDHVLKAMLARSVLDVVTGKLSDVAGLAFFPVLLFSMVEVAWRRPASMRVIVACVIVTDVLFALTKTWTPAADLYRHAIALLQWPAYAARAWLAGHVLPTLIVVRHVMDPTDLVALPAAATAILVGARRRESTGSAL